MNSLSERIADLPPEKRKLYTQLLQRRSSERPAAAETRPPVTDVPEAVRLVPPAAPSAPLTGAKAEYRRFYDAVTNQLDLTIFGQFSFFLNYGYRPDHNPQHAAVEVPEHHMNKNSVRLVVELIGECPLDGCRVLDVGCGRGGTVHVVKTMFNARSITGLDLSPQAIAFCRRTHTGATVSFFEGDAEQLPFPDAAFDIVTNAPCRRGRTPHRAPGIRREDI